jgi:internalin A
MNAQQLIERERQTRSGYLDLGRCGLRKMPDLSDLDWLETLILSNEWRDKEQQERVNSQNTGDPNDLTAPRAEFFPMGLKKLVLGGEYARDWEIKDTRFLSSLTGLTTLDLRYNQISDGTFLENLTSLQTLYLSSNQISDGLFLGNLTNLQKLDLSSNQINDGTFLENLTNLQTLYLRSNQISDGLFWGNLTNLQTLDLSSNQISDGSFLENLTNLQILDLSSNQISDGSFLKNLTNLQTLYLSSNQISDGSFLKNLTNLQILNLGYNKISDWAFLGKLTSLQVLGLRSNQISDGSFLSPLSELTILDLNYNQLSDGSFLGKLPKLQRLYITENPLVNPSAAIVNQGNAVILEYFRQKAKTGAVPLLEAKLILLGDGRAGKTSLANRLLGKPLPQEKDRTMGVDIVIGEYHFEVQEGEFTLHIWDFAGQDKYKPLHQFFYTEDAVYVMVADSGNAGTDYDDWLQTAQLFGAGSPLLVALNEFREGMGHGVFDEEHWKKRFPALLKEVHLVNLLTQSGVADLEKDIRLFAQRLPHTAQEYPKNWAAIRQELERRRDENFITWAEYQRICQQNDLPEREGALILSGILHKIGVCLHYQNSPLLKQYVILKNEWATDAVYRVLEDRIVTEEKKGFFDWDDLHRIWSDEMYQDMCPQLLELMQHFELAYPLPNKKEYVTPPLLPPAPPTGWEMPVDESLQLLIEYEFLPKALMTQFIVQRHTDIDRKRTLVWRNGVVLRWPDALAEVVKTKSQGRDAFAVQVQGSGRKGLLTSILKTFRDLHADYKGIRASEIVPCPCMGCRTGQNKQHFFDLENLKNRFERGRSVVECDKSLEEVSLLKLLGDLLEFKQLDVGRPLVLKDVKSGARASDTQPLFAFFSYSKHDTAYLTEFRKHLRTLERSGKIRLWDDRDIRPGEEWDDAIRQNLAASDIIFLLVSVDFLNTDYIWNIEITEAIRRHDAREATVIPIKIRPCSWAGTPFSKLQGLPRKDQIIGDNPKNDAAWMEVVKEIEGMI